MKIWRAAREEVRNAWRSVQYDLARRPWRAPGRTPADPNYDPFEGGPRRVIVSAGVAALVVGGAVGSYFGVVNGLGPFLEHPATPGALPATSDPNAVNSAPASPPDHGGRREAGTRDAPAYPAATAGATPLPRTSEATRAVGKASVSAPAAVPPAAPDRGVPVPTPAPSCDCEEPPAPRPTGVDPSSPPSGHTSPEESPAASTPPDMADMSSHRPSSSPTTPMAGPQAMPGAAQAPHGAADVPYEAADSATVPWIVETPWITGAHWAAPWLRLPRLGGVDGPAAGPVWDAGDPFPDASREGWQDRQDRQDGHGWQDRRDWQDWQERHAESCWSHVR